MQSQSSTRAEVSRAPQHVDAAVSRLSPHQWVDVVQYLTADDLKALRLAGGRELYLSDPSLTCHLQLRMDKAPFFAPNNNCTLEQARMWLTNRRRVAINDPSCNICPHRVSYLVQNGYMDVVSEVVIYDAHVFRSIFSIMAQLPNIKSLKLASTASDQDDGALDELEQLMTDVGNLHSLDHLDIEFDCVIHGSRLSFLRNSQDMKSLRLRGFDLNDGLHSIAGLKNLSSLHLCHGNFFSSPSNDVNEKDLINLMALTNVKQVHLEGFDCLSETGLKPFYSTSASVTSLVLKHCQDMYEECLPCIGRMQHLTSLHIVNSAYDDVPIFDAEGLRDLNALSALESLSLFYVLDDLSDLRALWGLSSLKTLNLALDDAPNEEALDFLCQSILPMFGSLKKLRIFSEEGMGYSCRRGKLDVEFAPFAFGDLVYLE